MKTIWTYNEFTQSGTDFTDIQKVEAYDRKMSKFRNYKQEAERIFELLNTGPDDILLDIGTGTGGFAIEAAKICRKIYALDVSKTMLNYAKSKADKENITNIEWLNSGFLTFSFPDMKFDSIVTNAALHHLPDFWKTIAINNIYKSLKPGGKFLLGDVIFSGDIDTISPKIDSWINNLKNVDDEFYNETITHVKNEYSTFSWLIEEIFKQVGFQFKVIDNTNNFMLYLCSK